MVNTHLHVDDRGGYDWLRPVEPTYVQRQELVDARTMDDYTILDRVDAPGVDYAVIDGEHLLLPGIRLVPAPGHTRGVADRRDR